MRFFTLLLLIICMKSACAKDASTHPFIPVCGDFLKQLGLQRADIQFTSCKRTKEGEFPPGGGLISEYRVKGKNVNNVENWLVHIAPDIKRLRFNCCGWETTIGGIKGRHGEYYSIVMGSGETIIDRRENLPSIPFMYITVTYNLDD